MKTNMSYKLWLEDSIGVKPAPLGWVGAVCTEEAKRIVLKCGVPSFISFDFDLGEDDTAEVFIKWLIENYYNAEIEYNIHSENVEGRKIIQSLMDSWKKSKTLELTESQRIEAIAKKYGISESVADDIDYLDLLKKRIIAAAKKYSGAQDFPVYNEELEDFLDIYK